MIQDTSPAQQNLATQRDRITQLLTKQANPSKVQQGLDLTSSFLTALSNNTGAAGVDQAQNQIVNQRSQAQSSLYNLMQDEVHQGNEDAAHVDKAIKDITGNDANAYEKIANEIHNSPEKATRANATLLATRAASKMGFKPMAYRLEQLQLQKLNDEAAAARATRAGMNKAGFSSPKAYEKYQDKMAENAAAKQIALPKVEGQATQALKLVNDIISHPGMTSMVGSRLGFGSMNTLLPDWAGGKNPIAGTDAANFKAKFEQLQGKQFLEAYEALKGGGAITEIEGQKATKAISDMSLAQSEEEFLKSANELKDVIQNGVKRAKGEQVFETGGMSSIPPEFYDTNLNELEVEKAKRGRK